MQKTHKPVRVFFTGVGGQGTLLATRLVGEAALAEGIPATMSEIHGMAQRGGVVESSVVMGDIHSPTIPDGEAHIMMAFEPLEALRAIAKCSDKTFVIANTAPIVPFTVSIGQSVYPEVETLKKGVEEKVAGLIWMDMVSIAAKAGSERASNIVMVGVLAGAGKLPISKESWQEALKRTLSAKILEVNQKAFEAGFKAGAEAAASLRG